MTHTLFPFPQVVVYNRYLLTAAREMNNNGVLLLDNDSYLTAVKEGKAAGMIVSTSTSEDHSAADPTKGSPSGPAQGKTSTVQQYNTVSFMPVSKYSNSKTTPRTSKAQTPGVNMTKKIAPLSAPKLNAQPKIMNQMPKVPNAPSSLGPSKSNRLCAKSRTKSKTTTKSTRSVTKSSSTIKAKSNNT